MGRAREQAGQKFCGECGAAFAATPASRPAAAEFSTHKYLTEQLLASASALEGERKHVTVLFADMKGSLEAIAGSDLEEVRTLLDPVIEHMKQAVHRYGGTVNRVAGDGIMALFGAPLAQEDHACARLLSRAFDEGGDPALQRGDAA